MAPIKRHRPTQNQHKIKPRRRHVNDCSLYERIQRYFGFWDDQGGKSKDKGDLESLCGRSKLKKEQLENSREGMGYRSKKQTSRIGKGYGVNKRHRNYGISSTIGKRDRIEGLRKARKYIKKALDFGIESGYLVPSDSSLKVLRVSSDLMTGRCHQYNKGLEMDSTDCEKHGRRSQSGSNNYEEEAGKTRRRRGMGRKRKRKTARVRSSSRKRATTVRRRRRRSASTDDGDELGDDADGRYSLDGEDGKKREDLGNDNNEKSKKPTRSSVVDGEKPLDTQRDDASDASMDDDESDVDDRKNRKSTAK